MSPIEQNTDKPTRPMTFARPSWWMRLFGQEWHPVIPPGLTEREALPEIERQMRAWQNSGRN